MKGFATGGKLYGYNNVPIANPTRTGKHGRPAVLGVRLVVNPEQATVIKRIFAMYAEGMGQGTIAIQLNGEGLRGPYREPAHDDRFDIIQPHEARRTIIAST